MSHARDRIHKLIAVKKQSQNLNPDNVVEMPLTHRRSSILPCHLSAKRLLWSLCPRFLLKVCPSPSPPYSISQLQCLLRGSQLAASLTLATIPHVTLVLLTELMGTDVVKSDAAVRWSHYSPASFIIKLFPAITSHVVGPPGLQELGGETQPNFRDFGKCPTMHAIISALSHFIQHGWGSEKGGEWDEPEEVRQALWDMARSLGMIPNKITSGQKLLHRRVTWCHLHYWRIIQAATGACGIPQNDQRDQWGGFGSGPA